MEKEEGNSIMRDLQKLYEKALQMLTAEFLPDVEVHGDFYNQSIDKEKIKQANIGTEVANIKALNNVEACWETMSKHLKFFKSDTILKRFLVEIAKARAVKAKMDDDAKDKKKGKNKVYNELKDCASCLGMELPEGTASFNPDIASTILKQYPMIELAKDHIRYSYYNDNAEGDKIKKIAEYVELVNNSPCE